LHLNHWLYLLNLLNLLDRLDLLNRANGWACNSYWSLHSLNYWSLLILDLRGHNGSLWNHLGRLLLMNNSVINSLIFSSLLDSFLTHVFSSSFLNRYVVNIFISINVGNDFLLMLDCIIISLFFFNWHVFCSSDLFVFIVSFFIRDVFNSGFAFYYLSLLNTGWYGARWSLRDSYGLLNHWSLWNNGSDGLLNHWGLWYNCCGRLNISCLGHIWLCALDIVLLDSLLEGASLYICCLLWCIWAYSILLHSLITYLLGRSTNNLLLLGNIH